METRRRDEARDSIGYYREFAPHPALISQVRAFFSFGPGIPPATDRRRATRELLFRAGGSRLGLRLADASASIVFELSSLCEADGTWHLADGPVRGRLIGATRCGVPGATVPAMVGAYLQPAQLPRFARTAARDLTDQVVELDDLWGPVSRDLENRIGELPEADAIELLEAELLRRAFARHVDNVESRLDVMGLAALALQRGGRITVEELRSVAGVSRQYLTRVFHERVGVAPKLFCRLARFQHALKSVQRHQGSWAQTAVALGYADQSHMIDELKEFSSLTPLCLAEGRLFHPFIDRGMIAAPPRSA